MTNGKKTACCVIKSTETGEWIGGSKGGASWRGAWFREYPFTALNQCFECGELGVPKKIQFRTDICGFDLAVGVFKESNDCYLLCPSCWNKAKPIAKKMAEANEIKVLISKLNLEIKTCQR